VNSKFQSRVDKLMAVINDHWSKAGSGPDSLEHLEWLFACGRIEAARVAYLAHQSLTNQIDAARRSSEEKAISLLAEVRNATVAPTRLRMAADFMLARLRRHTRTPETLDSEVQAFLNNYPESNLKATFVYETAVAYANVGALPYAASWIRTLEEDFSATPESKLASDLRSRYGISNELAIARADRSWKWLWVSLNLAVIVVIFVVWIRRRSIARAV
jgi:hypothetical protein